MKRTPRVGSTPKRVPPAASSSRVDTEKHDEPLVGKRKGMGKKWNMKRKLYLPQTRDQPDMRAMRVAKAATHGRQKFKFHQIFAEKSQISSKNENEK